MGNNQSDSLVLGNTLSFFADVSFRTSNYAPLESEIRYKVLLRRGGSTSQADHDERNVASASVADDSAAAAEQRRKFVDPGSEIDHLLADGYNLVAILPLSDNNFLIFMLRSERGVPARGSEFRLNVVNAELKLERLRGETLVVGSQKLVLAGADQAEEGSDELLEAIAHETANGGRLIAAWPNGPVVGGLVRRLDVVFQIPTHCGDHHYAYQLSFTSLLAARDSSEENAATSRVNRLSDEMHKALEAGWSLVDTLMASPDVLIWFLEREVTDALINEPLYEGRLVEFSFVDLDPDEIANALNNVGREGWMLRSVNQVPLTSGPRRYIAFFQRHVERSASPSYASRAGNATAARQAYAMRDAFAPPIYRSQDEQEQMARSNAFITDDDECDLPHYEDVIGRRR